jgi:hypothetical protein
MTPMLKTGVTFRGSDGREYPDAGSMLRAGVGRILEDAYKRGERAASASVCPEHGERAIVRRQPDPKGVKFTVSACCETQAAKAREALHKGMAK